MPVCSDCQNAAFASSGVYCMALGEHIYDEMVADECGLYEGTVSSVSSVGEGDPDEAGGAGEADIISLNVRSGETTLVRSGKHKPDEDDDELERVAVMTVEVAYFGRAHNGHQVLEKLRRICQLEFGSVEVN